ncbi:MAG: NAD-dependent epimerase/dehydratase family protein [Candidatus Latescibacteria bacterium]|jgi:UDP-glucose 4-epimerase|nr:NAD-dependent epimerase/dehydratase family protein [Candidatus Latescibacterota bacterium]
MSQSKTIVVTGGAGLVGSCLCARLLTLGHKVISLDNYFTGSTESHISGVDYRQGHSKDIEKHITESPDLIYHLGEYSRVEVSLTEPALVWDLNMAGTFGVLEFWRKHQTKLVYAGSSTKFADGGMGRDQSPYAFTKATNTELVGNYADWYTLPYAITYFYNVYGPGERAGKYGTVIEIFRQKSAKGETLSVTAPGTQQRNFTHVEDIVNGLILVGEKGEGDDFGLGASESYSILDIAKMFGAEIEMRPEAKGNRMGAKLDVTKSQALGWRAEKRLEDYIREVTIKT